MSDQVDFVVVLPVSTRVEMDDFKRIWLDWMTDAFDMALDRDFEFPIKGTIVDGNGKSLISIEFRSLEERALHELGDLRALTAPLPWLLLVEDASGEKITTRMQGDSQTFQ